MNYAEGDQVNLFIVRATQLGYVVLIDNELEGLLFKSDVFQGGLRLLQKRRPIYNFLM